MVATPLFFLKNYFRRPAAISVATDGDSIRDMFESQSY